ncbi:MAG: (d)CMP kinase [Clostridia bacterium]
MTFSIAIDGPAGSGKSTMAKLLSQKLGAVYLDTGAMYRTVALKVIASGKSTRMEQDVNEILEHINMKVEIVEGEQRNILDGVIVNEAIRSPEVSMGASDVGAFGKVREKMVGLQRELSSEYSIVMEGRDIGTYVLPHADYKFFLTASVDERARRRQLQLEKEGSKAILEDIRKDMEHRDRNDSQRSIAPLKMAEDAIHIDTTLLSIEQVVEEMMRVIHGE